MPRIKNQKTKKLTRKKPERPLTLTALKRYNNKTFLPALDRKFATKKDLNGVQSNLNEVKEDLNEVKEDLNEVKEDLNEVKEDLNEVKEKLDKLNDVPDTLDKILKITEDIQQENTMQVAANERFDKHLENHETRITKLELATKSAP